MKYVYCILIFLTGMTTANNLSLLVARNPDYYGSWWKVAFSLIIFITFTIVTAKQPKSGG